MTRHASMLVTLGLAALLPAVSGCGDSRASTSSGEPKAAAADAAREDGAHAGGGGAAAVDGAESSATKPPHPAPALKLGADLAWTNMAGESQGDMKSALQRHGGEPWRYVRIDVVQTKDRGELQTHLDPKLVVADEAGVEHTLQILGPIVEHRATGTFKLLTYRD